MHGIDQTATPWPARSRARGAAFLAVAATAVLVLTSCSAPGAPLASPSPTPTKLVLPTPTVTPDPHQTVAQACAAIVPIFGAADLAALDDGLDGDPDSALQAIAAAEPRLSAAAAFVGQPQVSADLATAMDSLSWLGLKYDAMVNGHHPVDADGLTHRVDEVRADLTVLSEECPALKDG